MSRSGQHFVVTDSSGNVSAREGSDDYEPETFSTQHEAEARAKALAEAEPGEDVIVYRAVAVVRAAIATPAVMPIDK